MDYKTIRKSASLTGVVFTILIVIGLFSAMFLYWEANASSSGETVDVKYNDTFKNLTSARDDLDNNVKAIQDSYEGVQEATTGFFSWNGLRLLGSTLKLPISFLTTSITVYESFSYSLTETVIPSWVGLLVTIGITAFIIFLLLSILRGRS